jgi:hypothetical protein
MLTEGLIRRRCKQQDHDRLVQDLVRNGLPVPVGLWSRLAAGSVAAPALALRRLTELTYAPTPASRAIAGDLLVRQDEGGAWDGDPLATACAVAALDRLVRAGRPDAALIAARDQAIAALLAMQADDGSFAAPNAPATADRLTSSTFILYLLADCAAFTNAVRLEAMLSFIARGVAGADEATQELWQMARLVLRPMPAPRRRWVPAAAAA